MAVEPKIKNIQLIENTSTVIITITEDKAKVVIQKHFNKISKNKDWISALGLFVSFLLTLLTADFHDFLGIPAYSYYAIFIIFTIVSFFYLLYIIAMIFKNKDSVEEIIDDLKGKKNC